MSIYELLFFAFILLSIVVFVWDFFYDNPDFSI